MRSGLSMVLVWAVSMTAAGCVADKRVQRDDGAQNPFEREAQTVKAPPRDRCEQHGQSSVRGQCDEARYLGQLYVRKLSVGDEVCLEGGFGEAPGTSCLARAAVSDVASNMVQMEIRDAQPASRWHRHVMGQVWYEEGALVDLYLADKGY